MKQALAALTLGLCLTASVADAYAEMDGEMDGEHAVVMDVWVWPAGAKT